MPDNDKALSRSLGAENIQFSGARTVAKVALGAGLAAVALGLGLGLMKGDNLEHFFHAYLLNYCYFLSISLGALFFVTLQHLTRAGWSVAVRRLAELMAATFGIMALLLLPIILIVLLGRAELYPWLSADFLADHPNTAQKTLWLNQSFFVVRCLVYFVDSQTTCAVGDAKYARGATPRNGTKIEVWLFGLLPAYTTWVKTACHIPAYPFLILKAYRKRSLSQKLSQGLAFFS